MEWGASPPAVGGEAGEDCIWADEKACLYMPGHVLLQEKLPHLFFPIGKTLHQLNLNFLPPLVFQYLSSIPAFRRCNIFLNLGG
jgi:hypothetical protein